MNTAEVLEKPTIVEFEASIKNGMIELPIEYRNAFLNPVFVEIRIKSEAKTTEENLERIFAYGRGLAKKYGFTEKDLNDEIEAYRKEKVGDENCY